MTNPDSPAPQHLPDPVQDQFHRVLDHCRQIAPITAAAVRTPGAVADLPVAQQRTGRPWPAALRAWFSCHDGADAAAMLLPGHLLLSLDESLWAHEDLAELMAEQYEASYFDPEQRSIAQGESEPAGREAMMFLPSFVPIAAAGDAYLFVDTRPGPNCGCVTGWDPSTADQLGPIWPSLEAMLTEVADALESGATTAGHRPEITDGVLSWVWTG